jgi:hypothetical protein
MTGAGESDHRCWLGGGAGTPPPPSMEVFVKSDKELLTIQEVAELLDLST